VLRRQAKHSGFAALAGFLRDALIMKQFTGDIEVVERALPVSDVFSLDSEYQSILNIYKVLWRRKAIILAVTVLGLAAGAGYISSTNPSFTSEARVLIDPRKADIPSEKQTDPLLLREGFTIDSEIELIKSAILLRRAAEAGNIYAEPESLQSPLNRLVNTWREHLYPTAGQEDRGKPKGVNGNITSNARRAIFNSFRNRISIERVRNTHVIKITYSSTNKDKVAAITNAIAQAYIDDKLETRFDEAKRTNKWLAERIEKLKLQVIEADRAVELYKARHGIVDASEGLVPEQQQSSLNSRLILARAETASNKVRYDRLAVAIENQGADAAVADSLKSPVITRLRNEYGKAVQRAGELLSQYGSDHFAYNNKEEDIARIRSLIVEEMKRFLNSYRSDYEASVALEKALEQELRSLKGASASSGQKQVRLRELKRQAKAIMGLYTSFLDNFRKSNERETLPTIRARIIEEAQMPMAASKPKKKQVLLIALVFGLGAGVGAAFLRDMTDRRIWTQDDLEQIIPGHLIGVIPLLPLTRQKNGWLRKFQLFFDRGNKESKAGVIPPEEINPYRALLLDKTGELIRVLRNILLSIHISAKCAQKDGGSTVTFVSSRPGEGKTTVSLIQALYLADVGNRTLLVDSDFLDHTLTKILTPKARYGFVDLQDNAQVSLEQATWQDEASGLHFLPASGTKSPHGTSEMMLISGEISKRINELRASYDYIVIDVPPTSLLPDARVMAEALDHVVVITEWGKVEKHAIEQLAIHSPELVRLIIGAVFNKVDRSKFQ
jgi:succinoglycan biosynthesis transport protein ExoP